LHLLSNIENFIKIFQKFSNAFFKFFCIFFLTMRIIFVWFMMSLRFFVIVNAFLLNKTKSIWYRVQNCSKNCWYNPNHFHKSLLGCTIHYWSNHKNLYSAFLRFYFSLAEYLFDFFDLNMDSSCLHTMWQKTHQYGVHFLVIFLLMTKTFVFFLKIPITNVNKTSSVTDNMVDSNQVHTTQSIKTSTCFYNVFIFLISCLIWTYIFY